jgi:putative colanic acid biosysnthesis UDP-glucose lipid carrier transferase
MTQGSCATLPGPAPLPPGVLGPELCFDKEMDSVTSSTGPAPARALGKVPATQRAAPSSPHVQQIQGAIYAAVVTLSLLVIARLMHVTFGLPYQVMAVLTATFTYLLLKPFDITAKWNVGAPGSIGTRLLYSWAALIGALLFLAYVFKYSSYFSRAVLLLWIFIAPTCLITLNLLVRALALRAMPQLAARRSAVVVFVNESARTLAQNLQQSQSYQLLGFFEDRGAPRVGSLPADSRVLGDIADVASYVSKNDVQVVFVMLPEEGVRRAMQVVDELGDTTASVYCVPDFFLFNLMDAQVSEVEGVPVLEVAESPFYGVDGVLKHSFDLLFAAGVMLTLWPLMLLIALAIKLDSPGPVLFKQARYGLNGQKFWLYKFRTMTVGDRETELQQVSRADPRVTRVGRFLRRASLDELPQFWNVLRGEMSVVGPRPHTVAHNEHYRKAVKRYMLRHKVKPGLTGWAQVHGLRGETSELQRMEERIRYDLDYIRHWSPWLDIRIVLQTVLIVLRDQNAY